jgi:Sporulation related domain.
MTTVQAVQPVVLLMAAQRLVLPAAAITIILHRAVVPAVVIQALIATLLGVRYAVQVVASPNSGTAEAMRSQMQSMGFNAVVDQVGGYYKVRVPFSSESEAKANLGRIRSSVPDAFYTVR